MRGKILIVDDNTRVQESLSQVLIPLGYETQAASNMMGARSLIDTSTVDVVLLDIKLGRTRWD